MELSIQGLTPYLAVILPFVLGLIALAVRGRLDGFARETVAAVYRVSIRTAEALRDEGLEWLRSEDGISYRQVLASDAYDLLPAKVGPIPTGLIKVAVSKNQWCAMVEAAFQEIVKVADRLEE